ncbi:MAG: hypothetical protein QOF42_3834 [Gammaproteobacteria bacterium]|nr:hypothetical protein [Gammaproteobacteria bacterium]
MVDTAYSVGGSLAASAATHGTLSRQADATRPRALRLQARITSVVVMLVVTLISVSMFVAVVPTSMIALALFPTLPL